MEREATGASLTRYKDGGGVWESYPPTGGLTRSTGFEVPNLPQFSLKCEHPNSCSFFDVGSATIR